MLMKSTPGDNDNRCWSLKKNHFVAKVIVSSAMSWFVTHNVTQICHQLYHLSITLTRRVRLSLFLTLTHTHYISLTHTHTLSLTLSLSHTHTHSLSLSHSLTLTHTHIRTHTLSLSHIFIHIHTLSLTHTHTHTHTLFFSLSLSHKLTPVLWLIIESHERLSLEQVVVGLQLSIWRQCRDLKIRSQFDHELQL